MKLTSRPEGFSEGKVRRKRLKSRLFSVKENFDDEIIVQMQHEVLYFRQEVEF